MLAAFASVNSAQRVRQSILKSDAVKSKIIQTPSAIAKDGCGYSLRFDDKYKSTVVHAASELKINIRAFYRESDENGKTQYIKE